MQGRVLIVIPAYNEEQTIIPAIRDLKAHGFHEIVVVDDGSCDRTAELAEGEGICLYRHVVNRGLGVALGTGIEAALRLGAEVIVTFDGDGQHLAQDVPRLVEPILGKEADVVIGSRILDRAGMPLMRRVGNVGCNLITLVMFGVRTSDSQSGLRAFSRKAAEALDIQSNGMEVSSEIFWEIRKNGLEFQEVPVRPIYTAYSLSKGQSLFGGVMMLRNLIWLWLRGGVR